MRSRATGRIIVDGSDFHKLQYPSGKEVFFKTPVGVEGSSEVWCSCQVQPRRYCEAGKHGIQQAGRISSWYSSHVRTRFSARNANGLSFPDLESVSALLRTKVPTVLFKSYLPFRLLYMRSSLRIKMEQESRSSRVVRTVPDFRPAIRTFSPDPWLVALHNVLLKIIRWFRRRRRRHRILLQPKCDMYSCSI